MQKSRAALSAGQDVIVRDERWTIVRCAAFESASVVMLRGAGRSNRDQLQAVLIPVERVDRVVSSTRLRQRSRRVTLRTAAQCVSTSARWDQCWTAATAAIDLHAWQFEPAIAAVTGAARILIADAVGLGKTIEAGLLVSELFARGLAERVLILTPAAIREQWADELRTRFALQPAVFDQAAILAAGTALPPDVNPWQTENLIISSIDLVKRDEVRPAIEATAFDVLIVDEAHHLTPGSDRGGLVAELATRVPWVVLVTATPHSGDDAAHAFLTSLGAVGNEPLTVFRRAASGAGLTRRSRVLLVSPTPAEAALLTAAQAYARALASRRDSGARLVGSIIARRAASSAHAVRRTLARRIALLTRERPPEQQPLLPWEEVDAVEDELSDAVLAVAGLPDVGREIAWLEQLAQLAADAELRWSKLGIIRRVLRRTAEQVLVFSEYRDVALQLTDALRDVTHVAALHGGLAPRERREAVTAFNTGAARVLVATDAAGEGLNLQARCRLVVNVELPWSPLRLEQRIGRVDRIGQVRRVHAIHLVHRDSYEATVMARLERRRTAADRPFSARVAAGDPHPARARRVAAHAAFGAGDGVYASRGVHGNVLTLLFAIRLTDGGGGLVAQHVVGMRVEIAGLRRVSRRLLRALSRHHRVQDLLASESRARLEETERRMTAVATALGQRVATLQAHLERASRSQHWQDSLFAGRPRSPRPRRDMLATVVAHLDRRHAAVRQLRTLQVNTPRLVAAWLS